jgi:hypothetical protein
MATDDELLSRLEDEEDALVERKPQPERSEVRRAVCAFANSVREPATGVLFLGVDNQGRPNGKIGDPDKTARGIPSWLSTCYPLIAGVETHALKVAANHIVAVVVPESRDRPHFTGPAFVRDGSSTHEASGEQFQKLIEDRSDLVWWLRPYVGTEIAVELEAESAGNRRYWRPAAANFTLLGVNQHFVTVRQSNGSRFAYSLRRIFVERLFTTSTDMPLLRVSLGGT